MPAKGGLLTNPQIINFYRTLYIRYENTLALPDNFTSGDTDGRGWFWREADGVQ